jgi:hypothetical protein
VTHIVDTQSENYLMTEEHVLRVLENRALRIIFGPKRDEMTGY